jgi:hypothetical protein
LATRYEQIQQSYPQEIVRLRQAAFQSGQHRRTPGIVADLALGLRCFLTFAQECGAITEAEAKRLWGEGWTALGEVAREQTAHQAASDPARRFLELLGAAIASGQAHIAGPDGGEPPEREAWGWRRWEHQLGIRWDPQGMRVGWIEDDNLYLEPDAAYAAAQRIGNRVGDGLVVSPQTLRKRLAERGVLLTTGKQSEGRETLLVRRLVEGQRRNVLHIHAGSLSGTTKPDQPDHSGAKSGNGQVSGADWSGLWSGFDSQPDHGNGQSSVNDATPTNAGLDAGWNGQVGQVFQTGEGNLTTNDAQQADLWSGSPENLTTELTENLTTAVPEVIEWTS